MSSYQYGSGSIAVKAIAKTIDLKFPSAIARANFRGGNFPTDKGVGGGGVESAENRKEKQHET
jgi:hypothetical protein